VNIAWCAEGNNCYPPEMLKACFVSHTAPLLRARNPHLILLGGSAVTSFKVRIARECPRAQLEQVWHFSYRKSDESAREEGERVRQIILCFGVQF
jgi:hypothetical protein